MKNIDLLTESRAMWEAMAPFRRDRQRCKRYSYGDQWSDRICVDGEWMREDDFISSQGNVPLKNNLIRRLVRNVVGVYRSQSRMPQCLACDEKEQPQMTTLQKLLEHNFQLNGMKEVLARGLEEYLISGMVVHKKWWGRNHGRHDCWTSVVSPDTFFCDTSMRDSRGWDASMVGEIHDLTPRQLRALFGGGDSGREAWLLSIYGLAGKGHEMTMPPDFGIASSNPGFLRAGAGKCRVIEVWQKVLASRYRCIDSLEGDLYVVEESELPLIEEANRGRSDDEMISVQQFADEVWQYHFLAPDGTVLESGFSPYSHGSHPYVFRAYPFIDGEIHSFVADVIDQQRYTNRLITMHDWMMRSSSKGALMIPTQTTGPLSIEEIARRWSTPNAVIPYTFRAGIPEPHQVSASLPNLGTGELLAQQLRFFEDISGVNDALQGRVTYAGTSGSLYSQQTYNATVSLLDLLESYAQFIIDSAQKDISNICQFYPRQRILRITGDDTPLPELDDVTLAFDTEILNIKDKT